MDGQGVLVIEDHAESRRLLVRVLRAEGWAVAEAAGFAEATAVLGTTRFLVVILDVMLPDGTGTDLCRLMRRRGDMTPVLMLTARGGVGDRVEGLDAGADDYLAKPFAVAELLARTRALIRRGPRPEQPKAVVGPLAIDFAARTVRLDDRDVVLTAREFDLLALLARSPDRPIARSTILEAVWGEDSPGAAASLQVLIARLRRKLETPEGSERIETRRGFGYALRSSP
jgi:two-component system response regulator MprA